MISTLDERPVQLSSSKRKRSRPSEAKMAEIADEAANPADFLRRLLALSPAGSAILERASEKVVEFRKPSEEDVRGYDMIVVQAIRAGNVDQLRALHRSGRTMDACNAFGESLLHMACRRGDADVVRFLVREAGVRVTARDDYGRNVVHDAFWTSRPNFDVLDELLPVVPTEMLLSLDVRGHTPFDYARKEFHVDWEQFLRDRSAQLKQKVAASAATTTTTTTEGTNARATAGRSVGDKLPVAVEG